MLPDSIENEGLFLAILGLLNLAKPDETAGKGYSLAT